jgi:hypothetical protein
MFGKPFHLISIFVFSIGMLACSLTSQVSKIVTTADVQPPEPAIAPTATTQPTEMVAAPTPTGAQATNTFEAAEPTQTTADPCENLGQKYLHDDMVGEINEDYVGSWHAAPSVGSGYAERFVFFPSGNYLFFPSQYECDPNDSSCTPSPIEEGVWGVLDGILNLVKDGDINSVRSIPVGEVVATPPDESPYPNKTTFDGVTYWLLSPETNLWNPESGELCQ